MCNILPCVRDMDDWSLALLSCKVFLKCYDTDTVILKKGDRSDYAYIILGGKVKVFIHSGGTCIIF